jgi:hypothetical protein
VQRAHRVHVVSLKSHHKAIQIDILRPSLRRIVGNLAAAHVHIRSLRSIENAYTSIIVLITDDTREGATP